MNPAQHDPGRPVHLRAAEAVRVHAKDPVSRRVTAVVVLGAVLAGAVALLLPARPSVLDGVDLPPPLLLAGLALLSCLAEITVVRLRHGDAVEELTLYEAALVIDVLLLPPRGALVAAVAGLVLAGVIQRRPFVKAVFNLGTYTAAMAVLILIVQFAGGTGGTMSARVLGGVVLGTVAFTMVNLVCLAQILAVINGVSPWSVVRSETRLSLYMAVGTVATGLLTTVIALGTPLLLPFMAMPAFAVTFAYRAAAREADERVRSASLLQLSHALAEGEDVVRRFLVLVREAFDADIGVIAPAGSEPALCVASTDPGVVEPCTPPPYLHRLDGLDGPRQISEGLPSGLRQVVVVPVESGERRFGTAAFATRSRQRMSTGDVTLLASLANALAVSLHGAEHLHRLTEERSKLRAVVDQSAEGIMVLDGTGSVQMWNQALTDLTGVTAAGALGHPVTALLDVPDAEERALLAPTSPGEAKVVTELTMHRGDGDERRLRLAHSAVYEAGGLVRDVVVISDLTREYRTERLKSDFIAMVSHELRTPLTPIIGYVDLLLRRGDRMTPEKRLAALTLIGDRAAHLSRLMEDLLLASKITDDAAAALRVSAEDCDLRAVVTEAVRCLGSDRIVESIPGEPLPAHCDRGRTVQILANLIGNGLKYSEDSRPVEVTARKDDTQVHVDVSDHGRGIPADSLERIFAKFHRVEDPMTMSTGGTGLGLFIARTLARAMNGDVVVRSTAGAGSVFTLSLPRRPTSPAAGEAARR